MTSFNPWSAMNAGVIEHSTETLPGRGKPSAAKSWLKAIELTSRIEANPQALFADIVEDQAARQPDRPRLLSDTETFSYRGAGAAHQPLCALGAGRPASNPAIRSACSCRAGRITSRPGSASAKVGGVAALINTKLVGLSLSHCINVAKADHVILAAELADIFETARAVSGPRAESLDAWRTPSNGEAGIERRPGRDGRQPAVAAERRAVTHQRPRAVDLHLRHHRPAEGRQHQPSPYPELGRLVCRPDRTPRPTIGCTIVCRCFTASAASSRPAAC